MPVTRNSKKKESFYAVAKGRKIGIFSTWDETHPLVKGFSGAKYKRFDSLSEARAFLGKGNENETLTYLKSDASSDEFDETGNSPSSNHPSDASRGSISKPTRTKTTTTATTSASSSIQSAGAIESSKTNNQGDVTIAILPDCLRGKSFQFFQDNSLLLCMSENNLYQVHSFAPKNVHSWFTSDYIMSGQCHYFTKVDPILVCLRHFYTHTLKEGKTLNQVFNSMPVLNCDLIQSLNLQVICDVVPVDIHKDNCWKNATKYQINLNRTLTYLQGKVNSVVSLVTAGKIKCTDKDSAISLALEHLKLFLPDPLYEELLKRVSP